MAKLTWVARVEARTLITPGGKETTYRHLQAARRAARECIPRIPLEMMPKAPRFTALARPEILYQMIPKSLAW